MCLLFFFFNDTATTEIYTLSLHDALPISFYWARFVSRLPPRPRTPHCYRPPLLDRKSTRLNSSHVEISYAVFCLKKKKRESRPLPRDGTRDRDLPRYLCSVTCRGIACGRL